jgi:hypothetical protein
LKTKKKKKVAVNTNELLASIKMIKVAQIEQQRQMALLKDKDLAAEARRTANEVVKMSIEQMSFQFSVFDQTE